MITAFSFPDRYLTSSVIAVVSTEFIPGFTLALGFLLGGMVSPLDAVSATTILRPVNVTKTLLSIVAGGSLLIDAASLILFRFAVVDGNN